MVLMQTKCRCLPVRTGLSSKWNHLLSSPLAVLGPLEAPLMSDAAAERRQQLDRRLPSLLEAFTRALFSHQIFKKPLRPSAGQTTGDAQKKHSEPAHPAARAGNEPVYFADSARRRLSLRCACPALSANVRL